MNTSDQPVAFPFSGYAYLVNKVTGDVDNTLPWAGDYSSLGDLSTGQQVSGTVTIAKNKRAWVYNNSPKTVGTDRCDYVVSGSVQQSKFRSRQQQTSLNVEIQFTSAR